MTHSIVTKTMPRGWKNVTVSWSGSATVTQAVCGVSPRPAAFPGSSTRAGDHAAQDVRASMSAQAAALVGDYLHARAGFEPVSEEAMLHRIR
jgi:hypothetical protein